MYITTAYTKINTSRTTHDWTWSVQKTVAYVISVIGLLPSQCRTLTFLVGHFFCFSPEEFDNTFSHVRARLIVRTHTHTQTLKETLHRLSPFHDRMRPSIVFSEVHLNCVPDFFTSCLHSRKSSGTRCYLLALSSSSQR